MIIRNWIVGSDSCLELGGGTGRITKTLEKWTRFVVMLDISWESLLTAGMSLEGVDLIQADIANLPFRDSSVGRVVMLEVIHLLPDPKAVFREIIRVAKDESVLVLSIPNLQMNHVLTGIFRVFPRLAPLFPTFGPARWPLGDKPFRNPHSLVPGSFRLHTRRGTGLFNNYFGKLLGRFDFLALVDVSTSRLWFLKPDVLYKFRIEKSDAGGGKPVQGISGSA
jgi:SAM-dependent methyltransferase